MIKALFKYTKKDKIPPGAVVIDVTSNSGRYRELSPFVIPAPPAKNLENLWQFSKVYQEHVDYKSNPTPDYFIWRTKGFNNPRVQRYPMGKGRKPLYLWWNGEKLDYVTARKTVYAPEYARNVFPTDAYKILSTVRYGCLRDNKPLVLLDYDAYDHEELRMSLRDVINNPHRKCGHAFILVMMLTGVLDECIE